MAEREYIEREVLEHCIREENHNLAGLIQHIREHCPTADVAEVVHGEWVGDINMRLNLPTLTVYDDWRCSVCGHYYPERHISRLSNYCPNCGAKMDGKDEE